MITLISKIYSFKFKLTLCHTYFKNFNQNKMGLRRTFRCRVVIPLSVGILITLIVPTIYLLARHRGWIGIAEENMIDYEKISFNQKGIAIKNTIQFKYQEIENYLLLLKKWNEIIYADKVKTHAFYPPISPPFYENILEYTNNEQSPLIHQGMSNPKPTPNPPKMIYFCLMNYLFMVVLKEIEEMNTSGWSYGQIEEIDQLDTDLRNDLDIGPIQDIMFRELVQNGGTIYSFFNSSLLYSYPIHMQPNLLKPCLSNSTDYFQQTCNHVYKTVSLTDFDLFISQPYVNQQNQFSMIKKEVNLI